MKNENTTLENNLKILDEISKLEQNWNQYDADPFSKELIDKVKNIIKNLKYQPDYIFPTARNSIQLEYYNKNNDYLEFEIFENGEIQKFTCNESVNNNFSCKIKEIINQEIEKFLNIK